MGFRTSHAIDVSATYFFLVSQNAHQGANPEIFHMQINKKLAYCCRVESTTFFFFSKEILTYTVHLVLPLHKTVPNLIQILNINAENNIYLNHNHYNY